MLNGGRRAGGGLRDGGRGGGGGGDMRRIAGEIDSGEWGSGVYSVQSLPHNRVQPQRVCHSVSAAAT